jgi:hypothetical protein
MDLHLTGTLSEATSACLRELDGATLHWWELVCAHWSFRLVARGLSRGLAQIGFSATHYLDCPITMHNVRLRLATEQETEALRRTLPPKDASWLQREDHLVIECEEGTYSIWAKAMVIEWVGEPRIELVKWLPERLWPDGPRLAEV